MKRSRREHRKCLPRSTLRVDSASHVSPPDSMSWAFPSLGPLNDVIRLCKPYEVNTCCESHIMSAYSAISKTDKGGSLLPTARWAAQDQVTRSPIQIDLYHLTLETLKESGFGGIPSFCIRAGCGR